MKKQKGFSLIELLIVVAIILIIAAIAIPNLLRARISANESAAVANLRTINTALVTYLSTYSTFPPTGSFNRLSDGGTAANCPSSPDTASACLLDNTITAADVTPKSGYLLTYTSAANSGVYTLVNAPATQGSTGVRNFFTDQSGVIRAKSTTGVTVADPAI
ncbi:MAG: prepilin-type N-terminal cleavage/methylation domain-containing protein [Terriglobales bacterium]